MSERFSKASTDDVLTLALTAAVFFPWQLSFALIGLGGVVLLCLPRTRRIVFSDRRAVKALIPFVPIALLPPVFHRNWVGAACGAGILIFLALFLYLRQTLTARRAERCFGLIGALSMVAALYAIVEKGVYLLWPSLATHGIALPSNDELRCASLFGNPNEYASVITVAVLLAVHGLLEKKGHARFYWFCLTLNLVGMLLCGSLMGMLELYCAVLALLAFRKKGKLLLAFGGATAVGGAALWIFPRLLPHLAAAHHSFALRARIWKLAVVMLREAPLFGRGLLSYWMFSPDYVGQELGFPVRVSTNAHNLLLDGLLSFGLVGVTLLVFYLAAAISPAVRRYADRSGQPLSALAFAALIGAAVHGLCDVTAVWPQVTLLLGLVTAAAVAPRGDEG